MPLGRGSLGIGGPGFSGSTGRGTGRGTGNPVTREDLRESAKQQKAKKAADREIAISKRARETRIKRALAVMRRRSDKNKNPGILHVVRRSVSDAINGEPSLPSREESITRATNEVDEEIAAAKAEENKKTAEQFRQHGIGGRKTKKSQ